MYLYVPHLLWISLIAAFEPGTGALSSLLCPIILRTAIVPLYYKEKNLKKGKAMTIHNTTLSDFKKERASVPGSKGSLTVEAALAIPLFLYAVLCLVYLLEIQAVRICVTSAAQSAAEIAAEEIPLVPVLNPIKLKSDIVNLIGPERIEQSVIDGGSSGIRCWTSYYSQDSGEIHVNVIYTVRLPFPRYMNLGAKQKVSFIVKAWTGYENPGMESEDDQIVYVTDTGGVYHTDYQCTYLQLSIHFVPSAGLEGLRNLGGGRYNPCEKCVHGDAMAGVYITDTGTKYHNSLNCSGLKRSIRAVKKSEVAGMGECSRCGN